MGSATAVRIAADKSATEPRTRYILTVGSRVEQRALTVEQRLALEIALQERGQSYVLAPVDVR